jgi:ABC-2 type transport system ATP-binding protein
MRRRFAPIIDVSPAAVSLATDDRPLLQADGVTKQWPRQSAPILNELDLEIASGEIVGILGANGAGKTTLIRILAGMIEPDGGTVVMPKHDVSSQRRRRDYRREIGLLPAGDRGLYARMTVTAHLDLWGRLSLLSPKRRRQSMERAFSGFRLEQLASQRVDRLSMGQRQRLRAALAFLHDPAMVLLDEPTNSMDGDGIGLLREALAAQTDRGGACIWVGPDGVPSGLGADRFLALRAGRLVEA